MTKRVLALMAWLLMGFAAHAADLTVAHVGPFSGALAGNGNANYLGSKAYFDEVNAAGGINGNRIRLVREDDQYKPEETIRLLATVAQRDRPLAFINLLGSANVSAVLKDGTLDRIATPVVGITPGAESLRTPGSPWLFHIHAGDNAQLKRILSHLATMGLTRLAIAYQDIPFGKNGVQFVDEVAPSLKIDIVGRVPVQPAAEDLQAAASQLLKSGAQVYLMILVPNSGAALVRDVRRSGDSTRIYGMSYVPGKAIVEKAGAGAAVGIALAQVTPNPSSSTTGLTRHFHATMDKYAPPGTDHSQLHLIGYLSARIVVEGLRKAGPAPTPEKLAAALRRVRADLGGYVIDFASGNIGSRFVDIGVIGRDGRLTY